MKRNTLMLIVGLVIVASMVLSACQPAAVPTEAPVEQPVEPTAEQPTAEMPAEATEVAAPTEEPTPEVVQTTRKGGWLDEIVFSVVSADSVVTQLEAGAIDIYANGLSSKDLPAIKDSGLSYSTASGLYYDLLFNPAGPEFVDGRFNPFSNRKIREAMNWLMDRDYLNQEIYEGGGLAKFFPITTQFPDYADLADVARKLESYYAYDLEKAREIITAEMESMDATLVDGKWTYKDEPVTLIFVIRNDSDGTRIPLGDYAAAQMEEIGFTVDRQYKTGGEASPIWIGSDPKDGLWHMYTAAWSATVLDRDQSNIFQEMYLDSSAQGIPAFLQNVSDPEFKELGDKLATAQFANMEERHDMMARALELSLQDSLQVFLIDGKNYIPYANNVIATSDLAAGVEGAQIWPFTLRFKDEEGGTLRWATQEMFGDPWNPIAGSNWAFDQGAIRATNSGSGEVIYDPYTGLVWPMRMERAEVVVQEGLPVTSTLDWVTLEFAPEIVVPADAWADWDAVSQTFIPAGEGVTALRKTTVYYPADIFETVKWHDGSNLSIADFVMNMIMTFDRAKTDSAIYDPQAEPAYLPFMENFKGFQIVSTEPLVIDYYSDTYSLDAELNLTNPLLGFYPTYAYGEGAWSMIAVSNLAEAAGEVAYSVDKAGEAEIEQTSWIGGPSLEILATYLDQAIADSYIPYAPTMSEFLTAEEAVARYESTKAWYAEHNHFWLGTGPYYVDKAFLTEKSLTLKQFADYPDLSDRWSNYGTPKLAVVELDGPGQVKIGEEATFDVYVTFEDAAYPADEIKLVKFLLYNAKNEIVVVGEAVAVEDGLYSVVLDAEMTGKLEAGSNKLEIAVVPLTVSQPTFTNVEFVTAP
ncbi:MAG: ABC transporter substrate-binding protein [Chloroflexi bacterium HGW-Chloroflexi-10]|nr:MAG: ABC transporter substrate-binding protein [Chloroflexi bacterium HGW-Chloroflexi-10]